MITKPQVHRHLEPVSNNLGIVETSGVLEIEVIVGGRIVVEGIADQKDLFDGRMERVDEMACRDEPRSGEENALIVFHAVVAAFDIEVVNDLVSCEKSTV